ncbi:hypothetical protein D9M71_831500 [compost metagenome]
MSVPEDTKLSCAGFAILHRLNGAIHAQELVVAGDDLDEFSRALIEEDVVLEDVHQVGFGACAFQQRLHFHDAGTVFV